jgi:S1-C subfamily serine protease
LAATAGYDQAAGYAIPVDDAFRRIVETLRQGREVEYGLLGVILDNMNNRGGILARRPQGALVREAIAGGPAERAGLQMGDLIVQVGGTPIRKSDELILAISKQPPLATTQVMYLRDDREQTASVELSKAVPHGEQVVTTPADTWRGMQIDFATAVESFPTAARQDGISLSACVAVRHVEPHTAAWKAGLRAGTFISHVNERPVHSPDEFFKIAKAQTGRVVVQVPLPQNDSRQLIVDGT